MITSDKLARARAPIAPGSTERKAAARVKAGKTALYEVFKRPDNPNPAETPVHATLADPQRTFLS
ncbi:hypothetical protein ACFPOC_11740 [Rubellimicrobium aerolatum]|uniref:Uncharacterized protein n=1 Tax=Rubellimicrobium aerolatum TaxID=490979 RepID=A0ABW0SDM3_9RHOB